VFLAFPYFKYARKGLVCQVIFHPNLRTRPIEGVAVGEVRSRRKARTQICVPGGPPWAEESCGIRESRLNTLRWIEYSQAF